MKQHALHPVALAQALRIFVKLVWVVKSLSMANAFPPALPILSLPPALSEVAIARVAIPIAQVVPDLLSPNALLARQTVLCSLADAASLRVPQADCNILTLLHPHASLATRVVGVVWVQVQIRAYRALAPETYSAVGHVSMRTANPIPPLFFLTSGFVFLSWSPLPWPLHYRLSRDLIPPRRFPVVAWLGGRSC
jgi:hypothetical protein